VIDIHTHILPGVDDGAQSMEESIEMLKKAAEDGVKKIVASPHVLDMPSESDWEKIRNVFNSLKKALIREKIDIDIILGAELFISPDLPMRVKQNKELTINNANSYILLELPVQEIPPFTEQTIFELLLQGIVPIISHPERYFEIQKDNRKLFDLVKRGVLTQVNPGSLIGKYGKNAQRTAKKLLSYNLVHIIGSDIHSIPNGSYPLSQGVNIAAEIVGMERAKAMVTCAPERIINGEVVEILPLRPKKRGIFRKYFRS
jgi:protein-tyrosine phosphatase